MSKIPFVKYHGAGNDFILIDDRRGLWSDRIHDSWVAHVCHRRFGIGADGLIILQPGIDGADFFMKYYNSDGRTSTFCGNGGRCIVAFAAKLGMNNGTFKFLGTDGWHSGVINEDESVCLSMTEVHQIDRVDEKSYTLFTGSPHYVTFDDDLQNIDVRETGRAIRNSQPFSKEGINVNFIESLGPSEIKIRTYERGVEDETMACGTGVVAAAIANAFHNNDFSGECIVHASGGDLNVRFSRKDAENFTEVMLIGPAEEVFRGEIDLKD
ncbi:MAG TPA: diaminopimelate epimerase [Saprospiraceae bacterium]|nr:diaminopimelate epimerase [Saprospiraceae bacterium]